MNSISQKLNNNLKQLNENLDKSNSFLHTFARGIVQGIATAIGATIIAGFLIALLTQIVKSIDDVPFLKALIDSFNT